MIYCFFFAVIISLSSISHGSNDMLASTRIAANGMKIQSMRMKVISQNIANANTAAATKEDLPYQRKSLLAKNIFDDAVNAEVLHIERISADNSSFIMKYEPHHPSANADGIVLYPNIDLTLEMADAKEAQRSYEANLASLEISKSNQQKVLEAMK